MFGDPKSDVHNSNQTTLDNNNQEYKDANDNRSGQLDPKQDK